MGRTSVPVMVTLALLAAAMLSTSTFDRTAACMTTDAPMLSLQAHAAFTSGAASFPAAATVSGGDASNPQRVQFGGVSALEHGYGFVGDACSTQSRPIPLSPNGLRLRGVFATGDVGVGVMNSAITCALARRAVVRVRALIGDGDKPTSGFLAVQSGGKTLKPLVYVAWTPTRVRVFASRACGG